MEFARRARDEMKRVLIIAYHFPPLTGGSGFLRIAKFCRYLPEWGWLPTVLTAHPRAYERLDSASLSQIPPETSVVRAFALDTRKHLSVRGRYFRWLALPDRWVSWCLGGVGAGLGAIRRHQIDVILTTFPVATAVLIGWILHRLTGKPWVADFRDSMTEDDYPRDPLTRRVCRWIEEQAVRHSSYLIFTAYSAIRMYRKRYPELPAEKFLFIPNGYDEEDFRDVIPSEFRNNHTDRPLYLLHLGLLYPEERDPRPFFKALGRLKRDGQVNAARLRIGLRASGAESYHAAMIREQGIEDLVELLPALPYRQALQEGATADGLLLFQGASCDHQIPAKAYEYLRLRKPIFALTSYHGDTAAVLNECGGATIVDLADEEAIYRVMPDFLLALQQGKHPLPDERKISRYSRSSQTQELARCFSQAVNAGARS